MTEYWTVVNQADRELLGIMECEDDITKLEEVNAVDQTFNFNEHRRWFWGVKITKAEYETYQAFGIKEIKV